MKKKKRSRLPVMIALILILLLGIGLLAYPAVSDWYYSMNKAEILTEYQEGVKNLADAEKEAALEEARKYNERLLTPIKYADDLKELTEGYEDILNVNGRGLIGYVSIPVIKVNLPIYHGVSEAVLAVGAGHMNTSSFPIGGLGTHATISAHTGTAQQRLFSDLEMVELGDMFFITVLDEMLAYEVDDISVVLPADVSNLKIDKDKDQVTLVTCTPYGVNSHRLLVRGRRVEMPKEEAEEIIAEIEPTSTSNAWGLRYLIWTLIGIGIAVIFFAIFLVISRLLKHRKKAKKSKESPESPTGSD